MRNKRAPKTGQTGRRTIQRGSAVSIQRALRRDIPTWLQLRRLLWPGTSSGRHATEVEEILGTPGRSIAFFSCSVDGNVSGFIEATLRQYVEGVASSPVGYIEGWYVVKSLRGTGVGRKLVETAEAWAYSRGAREMASDTDLTNKAGQRAHLRLGYKPIGRLVFFAKRLRREDIPHDSNQGD
jgi:aminoglycoside 6'-N-acetyltransferase I